MAGNMLGRSMIDRPADRLTRWSVWGEDRVAVAAALMAAAVLQWVVGDEFTLTRPAWLLPVLELAAIGVLVLIAPVRAGWIRGARGLGLALMAVISVDNAASAVLLDWSIIAGTAPQEPATLLASAAAIYLTNIIAFSVWFWQLDRRVPRRAGAVGERHPDFLFPQMAQPHTAAADWHSGYLDYLYVSFTNATAFSPTDTMPLTVRAKMLMGLQSMVALSTTVLVIARAVNLLR